MLLTDTRAPRAFRGYALDPFQVEAITYIEEHRSVLVSAPTGTGKTLIADYLIEKCFREGRRVVYTAPIKALSNQKFKEFKRLLGEESVGVVTGDVVIRQVAPVVIMTTEIFRNLVHLSPERLEDVGWVIFDEIHYIDDPDRGTVWEESLIFLPEHMRYVGLSATISNIDELAAWSSGLHGRPVEVVRHVERAVPLRHHLFEAELGFCTLKQLKKKRARLEQGARAASAPSRGGRRGRGGRDGGRAGAAARPVRTTHLDMIDAIGAERLPALFFTFSRKRCEIHARDLAARRDFAGRNQKERVSAVIDEAIARYPGVPSPRLDMLREMLLKGIGYHHAGLMPILKDIVEECFERRLISVLYCTETFAVGLNFPCRSVCFDAVTKWDGTDFRPISNREYFQMAGRAGRRGLDTHGDVYTLVDIAYFDPEAFPTRKEADIEPLKSQFRVSYNTILNLVRKFEEKEIEDILLDNFAAYQSDAEIRRISEATARLEKERDDLSTACEVMETPACPVIYDRSANQLEQVRGQIRQAEADGAKPYAKWRRRERSLRRELDGAERRACSSEQIAACEKALPRLRQLSSELGVLRRELKSVAPAERFIDEYYRKRALLERLDYVRGGELTVRGELAAQTHVQELLFTELFVSGFFRRLDAHQLNGVMVSIDYEPRKTETRLKHELVDLSEVWRTVDWLQEVEREVVGFVATRFNDHLLPYAHAWSNGASFAELREAAQIDEGDLVYGFRRGIDLLRQLRHLADGDPVLGPRVKACMELMDRDEVRIDI